MSQMLAVPFFAIESVWDSVEPFVERCFAKAQEHRYDPTDIKALLQERSMQLWIVHEGSVLKMVVMTEILNFPRCRELDLAFLCGEFTEDWRTHLDFLIEWAAEQGCHYVSTTTRPGMAKTLGWGVERMYTKRVV